MKIIRESYRARRTGLMGKIAQAQKKGVRYIPLKTAVDVYGAINIMGQLKIHHGIEIAVRRFGNKMYLLIDPPEHKPCKATHTQLRQKLRDLKKGECLLLTTPLEVYHFHNLRRTLASQGDTVRCKRNCDNLMVWVWQ